MFKSSVINALVNLWGVSFQDAIALAKKYADFIEMAGQENFLPVAVAADIARDEKLQPANVCP